MEHITFAKKYNKGKIAFVKCVKNSSLKEIDIKDKCFLLIILINGKMDFSVGNNEVSAVAPSFLCFDETINPVLIKKTKAEYMCIYFHPNFLNVNMSFDLLRKSEYGDIATTHDMFLLKPFIDKAYIVPIYAENITLSDISSNIGINHTTLTILMRNEFCCTAIEYLNKHRISVAKKQIAFTEVPIKDIANRSGFKTVQHFTRVFKKHTGQTPAIFRKTAVQKRKDEIV